MAADESYNLDDEFAEEDEDLESRKCFANFYSHSSLENQRKKFKFFSSHSLMSF